MSNSRYYYSHENGRQSTYSDDSRRYSESERSDHSHHSYSTAATDYESLRSSPRHQPYFVREVKPSEDFLYYEEPDHIEEFNPRSSVETYASTVPSLDEEQDAASDFNVPLIQLGYAHAGPLPSTPSDFAELFPSTRRLTIGHDDTTPDCNLNLRIDTQIKTPKGRIDNMTLFHLRMYDLKNREFSLRRYDRDSGREVCHTSLKASQGRPSLQRSINSALASFRKSDSKASNLGTMKRNNSGYESTFANDRDSNRSRPPTSSGQAATSPPVSTSTTKLEFSNYAHVDVKRKSTKSDKRYSFEYWGESYYWKRVIQKDGRGKQTSFHLRRPHDDTPLAHIVPEPMSTSQKDEERRRGGWIPPCSMWISDEGICEMQGDVSDVIVASGLIALVDDYIKSHLSGSNKHAQRNNTFPNSHAATTNNNMKAEHAGPKRFVSEMFGRPSTSHGKTSHRHQQPAVQRHMSHDR